MRERIKICIISSEKRDPRLYQTVIPPYKVSAGSGDYPTWSFTGESADREYIDVMGIK